MKILLCVLLLLGMFLVSCSEQNAENKLKAEDCVGQGENYTYYFTGDEPNEALPCCEGLQMASFYSGKIIVEGECYENPMNWVIGIAASDTYTCTACGDGECIYPEDGCNCPQDCKEEGMSVEQFCNGFADLCEGSDESACGLCTNLEQPPQEDDQIEINCSAGCPQLSPPGPNWCPDGDKAPSQPSECGCQGPPLCLPKENCGEMSLADAWRVALQSECVDELRLKSADANCNENSMTWWIDLLPNENGCNPACVVNTQEETAEINWRCTRVIEP